MSLNWKKVESTPHKSPVESLRSPDRDRELKSDQGKSEIARMETFTPKEASRNLDDLVLPETTRRRLEAAINRIRYHDKLYHEWNLKKIDPSGRRVAINFFGPPGTGKTSCAEAIANYLEKKIIVVNYAEIESKYVGETPKNITAAFTKASESDSILFFDEADSILGKRLTNVTQSADHGVNVSRSVMLLQLDSFDGIVIFASNLPENYDGAFVRRILAHIEFELPDQNCLLKLWHYLMPDEVPRMQNVTPTWLASQSIGLSGGDLLNVVKLATSQAVARTDSKCLVLQEDILEAINQIRNGKERVGVGADRIKAATVKETVMTPEELSPVVRERYDAALANLVTDD
jgi:SpoVK/Ycf46/Vps4 family AAA+-type ATPase